MPGFTAIQKNKNSRQDNPVFSILIPTWNNLPYLKLCVESICKNSHFKHKVIVHINEGTDGTIDWLKSQDDLDYTFSEKNIGVCYALNISSALAVTDYIAYMNDDMYVCPGWDEALLSEINNIGHNYFFFSSTVIEPDSTNNQCVIVKNYGKDFQSFQESKLLDEYESFQKSDWLGLLHLADYPPHLA